MFFHPSGLALFEQRIDVMAMCLWSLLSEGDTAYSTQPAGMVIFPTWFFSVFLPLDFGQDARLFWLATPPSAPNSAFTALSLDLQSNGGKDSAHLLRFSQFPGDPSELAVSYPFYETSVADVDMFLTQLWTCWATQGVEARHLLPSVRELENILECKSPLLLGILVRASRRKLGIEASRAFATQFEIILSKGPEGGRAFDVSSVSVQEQFNSGRTGS